MAAEGEMSPESKQTRTLTWIALLGALAVALPFLNKPFHIDDPFVLATAEQIGRDPLRPFSASFNWFDDPDPIFNITTNPPFVSYWLAPVLALFGPSEIALHLAMLPFLILMTLSMATLSRRFAQGSLWPVLFVMFSPAVVVSPNVMRDVPSAALATAAVALFVVGTDRGRWLYVMVGGILAGLAMVTKYSALIIVPVLALYPLLQRKPRYLAGLLPALAVLGLWYLENYGVYGQVHLFYLMKKPRQGSFTLINKSTAALVITGSCFILAPGLLAHAVRRRDWPTPLGAVLVAVATVAFLKRQYPGQCNLQYYLWAVLGAVLICWILVRGFFIGTRVKTASAPSDKACSSLASDLLPLTSSDSFFLMGWLIGPYLAGTCFVEFPAVRHILPAAAPIALLAVRYTQRPVALPSRWVEAAFGAALAVQTITAFWAAAADYQYADTYRQFAREAAATLTVPQGNRIWYSGHWGWQYYASAAGFHQITKSGDTPKPGDLVLVPDFVVKGAMPDGFDQRLEQIREPKRYPARFCAVTMDCWGHAAFYATFGTTVPFYFGRELTYEVFRVFRVKP